MSTLEFLLRGEAIVTSLAEMQSANRPNYSQLLGVVRSPPEQPPQKDDASPTATAEPGTDHPAGDNH